MKLENIFIHCSSSEWGEVLEINQWHQARGWVSIGYHYLILNGQPFRDVYYMPYLDGAIQPGRHLDDDPIYEAHEVGAHVAGRNSTSIGICLVGKYGFTNRQFESLRTLIWALLGQFSLQVDDVLGHYEDPHTSKTCPNLPMDEVRKYLNGDLDVETLQMFVGEHISQIYPER